MDPHEPSDYCYRALEPLTDAGAGQSVKREVELAAASSAWAARSPPFWACGDDLLREANACGPLFLGMRERHWSEPLFVTLELSS